MATAVSIAIRRDAAQARIQAASIELAAKYGVGEADLSPRHKQPEIQNVMTLEAVAAFLETLATRKTATTWDDLPQTRPTIKPAPSTPASPRKA